MILASGLIPDSKSLGDKVFGEDVGKDISMATTIFMAMLVIKVVFVKKMLDKGNELGSKWCEEGNSTLGAVLGGVGAMMTKTPIGSITRNITGRFAGKILQSDRVNK